MEPKCIHSTRLSSISLITTSRLISALWDDCSTQRSETVVELGTLLENPRTCSHSVHRSQSEIVSDSSKKFRYGNFSQHASRHQLLDVFGDEQPLGPAASGSCATQELLRFYSTVDLLGLNFLQQTEHRRVGALQRWWKAAMPPFYAVVRPAEIIQDTLELAPLCDREQQPPPAAWKWITTNMNITTSAVCTNIRQQS